MFPDRRRHFSPERQSGMRRGPRRGSSNSNGHRFLSNFQTSDGHIDVDKIIVVGEKVMELYDQVNPLISKFRKRK